jgi:hypothetical protein
VIEHRLWHIAVLASTLLAAAGAAILILAPLAFEELPPGLRRARPWVLGSIVLATILLALEWTSVH